VQSWRWPKMAADCMPPFRTKRPKGLPLVQERQSGNCH
jgi:hypothetical protein